MPVVILWEPRDPINVGAVIRACMLCDVPELRLVNPRYDEPERVLRSAPHGESFWSERTRVVESWDQAIQGVDRAYAFTARHRNEQHARLRLDDACSEMATGGRSAFVFGREDRGLPNFVLDRCHAYVLLETSTEFRSFNLAQAVMVAVHRAFVRLGDAEPLKPSPRDDEPAPLEQVERMMTRAEAGLDAIGFFKGDQRENVLRTIRRVLLRAEVDPRELGTFWALFAELERIGGAD